MGNISIHTTNNHKKLIGTYRPGRHGKKISEKISDKNPEPKLSLIDSKKFSKEQIELFNDIVKEMQFMKTLRDVNLRWIEMLLISYQNYFAAKRLVDTEGMIIIVEMKYGSVTKEHPAVNIMDKFFKQIMLLCDKLGLDPRSQSKINSLFESKEKENDDDGEDF